MLEKQRVRISSFPIHHLPFKKMSTKKIKLPFGIPGHNLTQVEREVPADEPPAWPVNDELKVVGKRIKRYDARAKVTGEAKYTADIFLPGMLYGSMLLSDSPHAKIKSIDTSAAERYPGVYAVHVFMEAVGVAQSAGGEKKQGYPDVKFAGQSIAGVAASSQRTADEAAKLIKVNYEYLPFVVDLDKAQLPDAPLVYTTDVEQGDSGGGGGGERGLKTQGNLRGPSRGTPRGNTDTGFAEASVIVEHTYRTQVQNHAPLETHGVVVDWRSDVVTIYASTQNTKNVRDEFAEVFGLPRSQVRVICEFMGGGFGAKHGLGSFGVMAGHLSRKTGRPVRMMLSRKAEFLSAGNRPNAAIQLKIGAKKDGKLTAIREISHGTAGVGLGAGVGRVAAGLYECPNFSTEQWDVFTHAGPGEAFRAPGHVQGCYAVEQAMDEMAEKLGLNPMALKELNDSDELRKVLRQRGAEKFGWSRRQPTGSSKGTVKKGIGMAQSIWGRYFSMDATIEVKAFKDGAVEVRAGVQDIGTGTKTVLAQVVAEELGLQPEAVKVRIGDTNFPDNPGSGGSVVTGSVTPPARKAACQLKMKVFELAAAKLGVEPSDMESADGLVFSKKDSSKKMTFAEALSLMPVSQLTFTVSRPEEYGGNAWAWQSPLSSVQFAEVTVNTETGFVKVDRIVATHSCGRPINIGQLESQINGGVIQGLSYALYENRVMDEETGFQMNTGMDTYKMPYAMEIPEIEIVLVEDYAGRSATDAYGIGEPANIATAPAIANAIYNAIGVRIYDLPITPDKILNALNKKMLSNE
jgi:xanthine dehydrogenase YagR molybdenum-binding subunit